MHGRLKGLSTPGTPLSRPGDSREDRFRVIRENLVDQNKRLRRRVEAIELELDQLAQLDASLHAETAAIIEELIGGARREIAINESSLMRMANNEFDCCMLCGATISLDQLTLFPYSVNCERCSAGFPLGYMDKLNSQHLEIRSSLEALSGLIEGIMVSCAQGRARGPDWAAALIVLGDLNHELPGHFALEEEGRYVAAAVAVAPRVHPIAEGLLAQHADFCDRLRRLLTHARQARTSVHRWAQVQRDFFRLSADLLDHERAENCLIGRAHREDIGSSG